MTQCYQNAFEFPRVRRRVVEARFNGGELTSDGGSLLLRQADRYLGLRSFSAANCPVSEWECWRADTKVCGRRASRLWFRASSWTGVTGLPTDLENNRREESARPEPEQTLRTSRQ